MNSLQSELHRLYLPRSPAPAETDARSTEARSTEARSSALIEPMDMVRAMVMELGRPASWKVLSKIWHGVQTELELPAPAIAVSGIDGLQLWFSLAEPIAVTQAHAFLECLQSRFLPDIESSRLRLMPASDASTQRQELHARLVPAHQEQTGNWSAFVAPDLAPIFADTPWLDVPPNEEGQAALLRGLAMMERTAFDEALKRLGPSARQSQPATAVAANVEAPVRQAPSVTAVAGEDPKRFLLRVMNDGTVALALRIEAAKALLQHSNDHQPQQRD